MDAPTHPILLVLILLAVAFASSLGTLAVLLAVTPH